MAATNPRIDVVVVVDSTTGKVDVCFESPVASENCASELWWAPSTSNYFLYDADEFYDESLRQRRNANLMYSPIVPKHRLVFVGLVWGAPTYGKSCVVVSRQQLQFGS